MDDTTRISKKSLEEISSRLSERDRSILEAIRKFRYLSTSQIKKLYFIESTTENATYRAANKSLKKLSEFGLVFALKRRIGGIRAGSASFIWCLTNSGFRVLNLDKELLDKLIRKRPIEPSRWFLEHSLAISELYVQLFQFEQKMEKFEIIIADVEPECWRSYVGEGGSVIYLKPDAFVITSSGDFEDYWFFEIDLATESPCRIVKKCTQYYRYYQSGIEQRKNGLFPLVVWIAPDQKRAESLVHHIYDEFKGKQQLFLVITPVQIEELLREGPSGFRDNLTTKILGSD